MGLVLSRHVHEKICIGSDIVIEVVDVKGDRVRLKIDAPRELPVHREEVALRIAEEGERA